jgi:hypothetical protein
MISHYESFASFYRSAFVYAVIQVLGHGYYMNNGLISMMMKTTTMIRMATVTIHVSILLVVTVTVTIVSHYNPVIILIIMILGWV